MNSNKLATQFFVFAIGTFVLTVILSYIIIPNIMTVTIDNSIFIGPATAIISAIVMTYIVFLKR